jgi:hypothetical protein
MRRQRALTPYERPMAFRRSFIVLVVVLGGLFLVRAFVSSPTPRAGRSPQQLAASMAKALLHVDTLTLTAPNQPGFQGQDATIGGSLSAERNGNFQITGQSEQDPAQRGEIRVVGGKFYFRYPKAAIYQIMRLVPQGISNQAARRDSIALANRWFTTGTPVDSTGNAPPTPTTARGLFASLGLDGWSKFAKGAPTTNQGASVVPLTTGAVTWFILGTGSPLPNALSLDTFPAQSGAIPILYQDPTIEISYAHVSMSRPTHLAHVPANFAIQWNRILPVQHISALNPFGVLWLQVVVHG